ncbi:hypothetical protein G7K_4905-t1 [Saitoella complicata NRRL Y-17804]|uniref:Uncharacterized protein n=1 Tax=Saitoella complicata (strain BCRC 22490 / CBS 7301 / JCM 7358 / NBRC 10748 / NRRL Y-17804) TaxID=698492 RepID=A0A0E9NLR1_SAICN|nr:hypothetical protein G7K_4905-t1 [Saitoella complicata NRRL Y-17804]
MAKSKREKSLKKRDISRRSIGILPPASRLRKYGWHDLDPSTGGLEDPVSKKADHDKRKKIQRDFRRDTNRKFREGYNDNLGIFLAGKIPTENRVKAANSPARTDCEDDPMSDSTRVGVPLPAKTLKMREKISKKRIRRAELAKWKKKHKKVLEGKTRFEKIPIEGYPGKYRIHTRWGGP